MIWIVLLIVHGLMALLLLGAITHQAVSLAWPVRSKRRFVESFAAVRAASYTNAIVVLYVVTFVFGGWIYANYRIEVKPPLEEMGAHVPVGLFELKEHVAAICLGMLPAYWFFWKSVPVAEQYRTRLALTLIVAFGAWSSFFIGHILNNVRGLGS